MKRLNHCEEVIHSSVFLPELLLYKASSFPSESHSEFPSEIRSENCVLTPLTRPHLPTATSLFPDVFQVAESLYMIFFTLTPHCDCQHFWLCSPFAKRPLMGIKNYCFPTMMLSSFNSIPFQNLSLAGIRPVSIKVQSKNFLASTEDSKTSIDSSFRYLQRLPDS